MCYGNIQTVHFELQFYMGQSYSWLDGSHTENNVNIKAKHY